MSNGRLELIEKHTGSYYAEGSPLLLEASALYQDKTTNSRVLQMKWRNIDQREINTVMIEISGTDTFGNIITPISFQYEEINTPYGFTFGEKKPAIIKNQRIVKYDVVVKAVSFSDGSIWRDESLSLYQALPEAKPQTLKGELLEQYKRDLALEGIEDAASFLPRKAMGLWQCGCGSWQPDDAPCINCGATWAGLSKSANIEILEEHLSEYKKEQERIQIEADRKAEEERLAAESAQRESEIKKKKAKRTFTIGAIALAIIIAAVLVVTKVIIPKSNYQKAEALRASGNYAEAVKAFQELGTYGDAQTQVAATYYAEGVEKRNNGDWNGAAVAFRNAGYYSDAPTQIAATFYAEGEARRSAQEWNDARTAFEMAGDYSDAKTQVLATSYAEGDAKKEAKDYTGAIAAYTEAAEYMDAPTQIQECYYQMALEYISSGELEKALETLQGIAGYKDSRTLLDNCYETLYQKANEYYKDGDIVNARYFYFKCHGYKDSDEKLTAIRNKYSNLVGIANKAVFALKDDGTLYMDSWAYKDFDGVDGWSNIVAISVGSWDIMGLKMDGTVIHKGDNDKEMSTSSWHNVDMISADSFTLYGYSKSGKTLYETGKFTSKYDQESTVSDSIAVFYFPGHYIRENGTVCYYPAKPKGSVLDYSGISEWTEIVQLAFSTYGDYKVVGLKSDGTVLGYNARTATTTVLTNNTVAISAGEYHYVCLKADGTVFAFGNNGDKECDVTEWKDIVAVFAGTTGIADGITIGLKTDGTLVSTRRLNTLSTWKLWK